MDTDDLGIVAYVRAGIAFAGLLFVLVGVGSSVADSPPPEYVHHISAVEDSPSAAPTDPEDVYGPTTRAPEGVIQYSNLSERGQTVFDRTRRAYERNGSDYAFGPDAARPPEFTYHTDAADWGRGMYYVAYEDQYYRLTTTQSRSGGFGSGPFAYVLAFFFGLPLVGFGALVLAVYGLWGRIGD